MATSAGILFICLLVFAPTAWAAGKSTDGSAEGTGHIGVTVISPDLVVTIPECSWTVTENCIEVVLAPECPADHPALDCISR